MRGDNDRDQLRQRAKYAWVTILPLAFVGTTTLVAGFKSITDIFWPLAQKPETSVQGLINTSLTAIIMFAAVVIMLDSIRRWLGTESSTDYRHTIQWSRSL